MHIRPLGKKSYGHIPHLPGSRIGPADHKCDEKQCEIATVKTRDKHDLVIVQEKLDGSNVGAAKIEGNIYPLTRAGYLANTSHFEQHRHFHDWVYRNYNRFFDLLMDNERVCGEWLMQAHGTRYNLPHEPFVAFDIMEGVERKVFEEFKDRVKRFDFIIPNTVHIGGALGIDEAMGKVKASGHGAIDPVEGAVWRIERNYIVHPNRSERKNRVLFLAKYVRPDKIDGCYLPEETGKEPIWNWYPQKDP